MNQGLGEVPAICREVGLTCQRCTEDSARSLATVCKGLRGKAISQMFHQIYPVAACAPMSSHFVRAYKAASTADTPVREVSLLVKPAKIAISPIPAKPSFERREVTSYRATAMAVAG